MVESAAQQERSQAWPLHCRCDCQPARDCNAVASHEKSCERSEGISVRKARHPISRTLVPSPPQRQRADRVEAAPLRSKVSVRSAISRHAARSAAALASARLAAAAGRRRRESAAGCTARSSLGAGRGPPARRRASVECGPSGKTVLCTIGTGQSGTDYRRTFSFQRPHR